MPTAEVRWLFDGPVHADIEHWFRRGGLASTATPREDHYVLFPAALGLNLKLREGRLEIKSLVRTPGPRTFAGDAAGTVQLWEKQTHGDNAVAAFERLRTNAPHLWITVRKERTLRKFAPDGDSMKEVAAGTGVLSEGCNVELTKIRANGSDYWSFALEAFGEPSRVEQHVQRVGGIVLADQRRPSHSFPAGNSRSYPEWLERFAKND
ncbi:MAG: hypothetical protein EPO02_00990 [Nitrospirae bacterium]|nr:MAG: hypothetical protein EPO02_00990 [Nitrospirota bacterium]